MSDILAPSKVGNDWEFAGISYVYWAVKPGEPSIRVASNPCILTSYKSKTIRSDRKRPTDYVRQVGRITPGGAYRASNRTYVVEGARGDTASLLRLASPYTGSNSVTGVVNVPQWMTDKVVMDALSDMNQIEQNILEDLGQLKQTGVLVLDIIKLIFELYQACRRGNFSGVRRRLASVGSNVPRSIANGWLMYFYGIKPLVGTIDALCASEKPLYKTYSVRKRTSTANHWRDYVTANAACQFFGKAEMFAQCELSASIKLDGNLRYWQNLGITSSSFTDAVVTAWALVPYSFVLDWFVPVETFLRTRVWSPFLEYQGGYTGKRHRADGRILDPYPWSSSGGPYHGTLPQCRLRIAWYKRTTYPYTVPPSALSIRLSLSSTQIISAAALIIQKG